MKKSKEAPVALTPEEQKKWTKIFWGLALTPFILITSLLLFQSEDDLPPVSMLDNPPEVQASLIIAKKNEREDTIIGRFWQVNRTSVKFKDISPYVFDALISTEDERFMEHSGVDFRALARSIFSLGSSGGASTISQQLAKMLFTLQEHQREELARAAGQEIPVYRGIMGKLHRIGEKARENIIAKRLEERFTKEEIITMYLNQFDFLYNAVGIENAARVYFNKRPKDLSKQEAAMLVGMCKNPALFNPYTYQIKNYKRKIADELEIPIRSVTQAQINEYKSKDSLMAVERRNQVLYQWLKNSKANNPGIRTKITQEEYDILKNKPVEVHYKSLDHKEGMAPYFRESLRKEVTDILMSKNSDGTFKYLREDGMPYDIYRDGLRIYTTLNPILQRYAEEAVDRHLREDLQPAFDQNNKSVRNYPFANTVPKQKVEEIMENARRSTNRYISLVEAGATADEIRKNFDTPVQMKVFAFRGDIDTVMTPNDSIRYYKAFLHAGLVSIDPQTGFVRAWVGGVNFKHFSYDHVRLGKRQVGSTIKPFVYATALSMKVVNPCTSFSDDETYITFENEDGSVKRRWRPAGEAARNVKEGLAQSSNPTTAAVMQKMGSFNEYKKVGGPYEVEKTLKRVEINLNKEDVVPSLCLGVMDISLYNLVAAECIFANNGYYVRPTTIERITDRNGKVIYSADAHMYRDQALNSTVAYEVLKMMKGVVNHGTGASLRGGYKWGGIHAPTAGKTGTTQNNSDGWFVGITPKLVTGIWVGAEDRAVRFRSMFWGQGARMALPIYGYYMQKAYRDATLAFSQEDFVEPPDYDPITYSCTDGPAPDVIEESDIPFEF